MIPKQYQKQLRGIYPSLLSNRLNVQGSGVQPVLNIIFDAETRRNASDGPWERGKFVLRKFSDDSTDLAEIIGLDNLSAINAKGTMCAIGRPSANSTSSHALLFLPIDLTDIKVVADTQDDVTVYTLPPQKEGESDNDYIKRPLTDNCIAYIDPHPLGGINAPTMPHLIAKLRSNLQGVKIKWRLEVDYQRMNGWRSTYANPNANGSDGHAHPVCFHLAEDLVRVPNLKAGDTNTYTAEMDSNQEWQMSQDPGWTAEINQNGFFGGTAKLYLWLCGQDATEPTKPVITFRIGGKNPDPAIAKPFIQSHLCDSRLWFAYAIAKKESHGYGEQDHPYYNQFFGSYRKPSDLKNGRPVFASGWDENKDWQCWAKGWPAFNVDRDKGVLTSAGGYGTFQNTGDAQDQWTAIPRRQIWNWQDNVGYQKNNVWLGAMGILKAKIQLVDARYDALQATYPSCGAIPSYPSSNPTGRKLFSGWDAYTCKGHNGFGGCNRVKINGFGRVLQYSAWYPAQDHWEFIDGGYTLSVWNNVEEPN